MSSLAGFRVVDGSDERVDGPGHQLWILLRSLLPAIEVPRPRDLRYLRIAHHYVVASNLDTQA